MGLFDFSNSSEQKKREALMNKINDEIFPDGQSQMEREIQEVRQLLGFSYSLEFIKETYIYASAVYYLSNDKDLNDIVSSIIRNPKTSVAKDDAIKLYYYLQNKLISKTLNNVVNKIDNKSDSYKLFMIAIGGIVELKTIYKDIPETGKFEVTLFNSLLILREYHEIFPQKYEKTTDDYFVLLFKQASDYGINMSSDKLLEFINSRFEFYFNELAKQASNDRYLQTKVYNNFYVEPLLENPESNEDIIEYIAFLPAYYQMVGWVKQKMNIFQENQKLSIRIFDLFNKEANPLEIYLNFIQSRILEIPELKNLSIEPERHKHELKEFKDFISIIISGSLYRLKVKEYLNVEDFQSGDPIDNKIFRTTFKLTLPFYRSYVINNKIIIGWSDYQKFSDDKACLADFIPRFVRYGQELKETFETGNTYFVEEREPEYDDELRMLVTGVKIYFEYVRLLFLTRMDEHKEEDLKVNEYEFWEVDDEVYDFVVLFDKPLHEIYKKIEIKVEMLR